jgi:gamma-glutamylcyclotransferase (GGCT)/AIG2-like uncharacterized protein YtfP
VLATLFVYGSLLSASVHPNARRLAGEGTLLGPATVGGRLYAIAWYPGLVEEGVGSSAERVTGEVYRLADPAGSLPWLDRYEGLEPGTLTGADYARVVRPVHLATGETIEAWVYLYTAAIHGCTVIADGRWPLPASLPPEAFARG